MTHIDLLMTRCRSAGVLVDANLLLLLVIGALDPAQVGRAKRTREFQVSDFELVLAIISRFDRILTTPHILTEVSNLIGDSLVHRLELARQIHILEEHIDSAKDVVSSNVYQSHGITDAAVSIVAKSGCLVLTADFPLANRLEHLGCYVLNLNHLRTYQWLVE